MKSPWNKQWNVYLSILYLLTLPITAGFLIGRYKGFDFWRSVYLTSSWLAFTALILLPLLVPRLLGCLPKFAESKIGRLALLTLTTSRRPSGTPTRRGSPRRSRDGVPLRPS